MKSRFTLLTLCIGTTVLATGCNVGVESHPTTYECYWETPAQQAYVCDFHAASEDGTIETSRDILTQIAEAEQKALNQDARYYASKFNLTEKRGMKLAKTIRDFHAIQSRSDRDVADFAERLYGVNPSKIATAVGLAQVGENEELNSLVAEAAQNFETTPATMKQIIQTLHGKALEQQGIRF